MYKKLVRFLSQCVYLVIPAVASCSVAYASLDDSSLKVKWGYTGNISPERWGELSPSFATCAKGKIQSPINIKGKIPEMAAALQVHYSSAPLNLINNGATELQIGQQSILDTEHGIQVNFLKETNETVRFNGESYQLVQFHIHTPSENTLQGASFPLEIHFVHQGEAGHLLVIGVFAKGGTAHAELQKIIANLPTDKGKEHVIAGTRINPYTLMPEIKDYFNFEGSLTTPPCTEGVKWIVMMHPISVASAQIVTLKKIVDGVNARPVQALNKRKITYSPEAK